MSRRRRATRPLAADPLWYKDAVFYQVHVTSFFDSNNDGLGDLRGKDGAVHREGVPGGDGGDERPTLKRRELEL